MAKAKKTVAKSATKTSTKRSVKLTVKKTVTKKNQKPKKQTLTEVSKEVNHEGKTKGFLGFFLLLAAATLFVVVLMRPTSETGFASLTEYRNEQFFIQHPEDWNVIQNNDGVNIVDGDNEETATSGVEVIVAGLVPEYDKLKDEQKDELTQNALEELEANKDSIASSFNNLAVASAEIGDKTDRGQTINFKYSGTYLDDTERTITGFVLIGNNGELLTISAGGNTAIYEQNQATFDKIIDSFALIENIPDKTTEPEAAPEESN